MKESVGGILAHEVVSKSAKGQSIEANRLGGGVAAVLYLYTFMYGSTWLTTWYDLTQFSKICSWLTWIVGFTLRKSFR